MSKISPLRPQPGAATPGSGLVQTPRPSGLSAAPVSRPPSLPRWLAGWIPAEPVPVPIDRVMTELAAIEAGLVPADPRYVAVELELSLEAWGVPANWGAIAGQYLEVFDDVPADLVWLACYRLRRTRFPGFPRPAEIRALILDELGKRQRARDVLRVARLRARPPEPEFVPPSEADKQHVSALVAAALGPAVGRWRERRIPTERRPLGAADRDRMTAELAAFGARMRASEQCDMPVAS